MTTSATRPSTTVPSQPEGPPLLYTALRIFAFIVLISMVASIVYSAWITFDNWDAIRV